MDIRLLGTIEVSAGGMQIRLGGPRQRAVLAALALHAERTVSTAQLIDDVWGNRPPASAKPTLESYVSRLRQVLSASGADGVSLVTRPSGYLLRIVPDQVDVWQFRDLAIRGGDALARGDAAGAARLISSALGLWRGPALADLRDAAFAAVAVHHLEEERLAALENLVEARLGLGQHREVVPELEALIAGSPYRERFHAQLMLALYRSGRQAEALTAFSRARDLLAGDLGIEPGRELRELQRAVLLQAPELDRADSATAGAARSRGRAPDSPDTAHPVVPQLLPAGDRHFVGRTAELAQLGKLLDDVGTSAGAVVITAIGGTGGIGKTALALQWAHQVAGRFPDGQLHVNLRGYDPSGKPLKPAEAIRTFLMALGVSPRQIPASPAAQAGLYRSLLANRRMLIVLDNAANPAQVRPLLPASPGSLVLVTSRSDMTGLSAADGAAVIRLGLPSEPEARELLAARLGHDRLAVEPDAVADLIALSGRLPLALAIIAAQAAAQPTFALTDLAAAMSDDAARLDVLETGEADTSVRTVLSWSYRQLSARAASMFRLLGLHPGPDITAAAAASLAGTSRAEARSAIADVAAASLIAEHVPGRYAFHDLLRVYAAELATAIDSETMRHAAVSRLLDHYLHSSYLAARVLIPFRADIAVPPAPSGILLEVLPTKPEALEWFQAEHHVLLASVGYAYTTGFDQHSWLIAWTLRNYLWSQCHYQDWAAVNRAALPAAERLDHDIPLSWTYHRLGNASYVLGLLEEGQLYNSRAAAHFEAVGDMHGEGAALLAICEGEHMLARHHEALRHAERVHWLATQTGWLPGQAYALDMAGLIRSSLGDPDRGLELSNQAFGLYTQIGDTLGKARALRGIGYAYHELGHDALAIESYEQALAISREQGPWKYVKAWILFALGDAQEAAGISEAAIRSWQQGLTVLGDLFHADAERIRARLQQAGPDEAITSADHVQVEAAGAAAVAGPPA